MISGATGFIGSHWTKWLKENTDHDILGIDDLSFSKIENFPFGSPKCKFEQCDITDYEHVYNIINFVQPKIIYHFAAISSLPEAQSHPTRAIAVNVEATANLLEQCRLTGVARFVFASSNAVYEQSGEFPCREGDDIHPELIYPMTKKWGEELCRTYGYNYTDSGRLSLYTSRLRFSNVYGPGQDLNRKSPALTGYILDCLLKNQQPTLYSNSKRDYIYIDDLIEFLKLELENPRSSGVWNVCSNTQISVKEILNIFIKKLNSNIEPIWANPTEFWDKHQNLFEGVYTFDKYTLEKEVNKETLCSNYEAEYWFKWKPKISMEEGIEKMVDFYRKKE